MSKHVTSLKEIPPAKYYVLSNDKTFSGWGHAENKINTVILPCADYAEAEFVRSQIGVRGDQTRIRIVSKIHRLDNSRVYYSLMSREDAPGWYALHFEVSRMNDPKDGLRVSCYTIYKIRRDGEYNVNIVNADCEMTYQNGRRPYGLKSLGDVISHCAGVAAVAGCRSMIISAD